MQKYNIASVYNMISAVSKFPDCNGMFPFVPQNVSRYQSLSLGAEVTESQLRGQLAEYLNAEIVLLTVMNLSMAMDWLRQSFLYVRVKLFFPFKTCHVMVCKHCLMSNDQRMQHRSRCTKSNALVWGRYPTCLIDTFADESKSQTLWPASSSGWCIWSYSGTKNNWSMCEAIEVPWPGDFSNLRTKSMGDTDFVQRLETLSSEKLAYPAPAAPSYLQVRIRNVRLWLPLRPKFIRLITIHLI